MTLISRFWHTVVDLTTWLTLSPLTESNYRPSQHPLGAPVNAIQGTDLKDAAYGRSPVFRPPAADPNHDLKCDYSLMDGWFPCSIAENRECWLRNKNGEEFNIHTDYEKFVPTGVTRHYTFNITEGEYNADGFPFTEAKLFNGQYPGPWLEACWGDTLHITVINSMVKNGTSIHWHGIPQNQTMDMDGVNGISQCPIPPGEQFTYVFKATQYGTSWYHSHYSMQYADGLLGPLTIHGPSSAPFDASKRPLLMTDWTHESAFNFLWDRSVGNKTILLNGIGNATRFNYSATLDVPKPYELHFEEMPTDIPTRAKRYLLRLINTSFDTTFVFSIDNHWLQIVSADFVPLEPYYNTSVLVGIGQRYNVIVEADPAGTPEENGNYWVRTWIAEGCGVNTTGLEDYEQTGILRYNPDSKFLPNSTAWTSVAKKCSDETYTSLRPKVPWYVGKAANAKSASTKHGQQFNVHFDTTIASVPPMNETYPVAKFSLQLSHDGDHAFTPLQVDYSDPTIMHLDEDTTNFPSKWVVIPENYTEKEWVYLVLTMEASSNITAAHPIHLHGHDFAILQQVEGHEYAPSRLDLKLDNPPRRDVVLLPNGGFIVIAFKADNPGIWLMHCHIAHHADEGLALQIMERQEDASKLFRQHTPNMNEAERICETWDTWKAKNHPFEGSSGI